MAVAIATPGSAGLTFSSIIAYEPANPASTATNRSSSVGLTLESISGVASRARGRKPNNAEKNIASTVPTTTDLSEFAKSLASPSTSPREEPMIGVIRGDTSIAPMITAVLLAMRPKAAIKADVLKRR